ncbi:uncharacterized protein MYCFIDRAFT_208484 [Pseudocercospora fijiensis CIRAD86]|uniref:Uncharacterized protein n=1 Tax=Pseudocercospora fijiensis (strain CIRAD86) TaxID=383855 RepID=M3ASK1_PSEFD|nr:uncharacterized protein MYCFIDRAFT_208484 [Pseudocercospora fijiensis CIRAD86]EME80128.1 hypothetical protein MYCFIDRAFT_208484 [Pseudocercospora fijiensis CIRAD86]
MAVADLRLLADTTRKANKSSAMLLENRRAEKILVKHHEFDSGMAWNSRRRERVETRARTNPKEKSAVDEKIIVAVMNITNTALYFMIIHCFLRNS